MSKHTPGPWEYIDATYESSMQYALKCVIRAGVKQIADFSWHHNSPNESPWWPTKAESQANARLIAAAPEMLEALRDGKLFVSRFLDSDDRAQRMVCLNELTIWLANAAAVISKAERN